MRQTSLSIFLAFALALTTVLIGCSHKTKAWDALDQADSMMSARPDSAFTLLSSIDKDRLGDDEEKARYALLMSMALDKNYIDTTSFDVLQPAIDYYLEHGSADERLRTFYYQGRIYQNQGDDEKALTAFLKAYDLNDQVSDSLLLAHALVAIGTIDLKQYKVKRFIQHNLDAANLYLTIGNEVFAIRSFANALGGCVMDKDKSKSDSVMTVCSQIIHTHSDLAPYIRTPYMSYIIEFGSTAEIKQLISQFLDSDLDYQEHLDFARAYAKLGQYDKAGALLSSAEPTESMLDSLKYLSIKTMVSEGQNDYKDALDTYRRYSSMSERHQESLMSDNLSFIEERHQMEINSVRNIQKRDRIILGSICGILMLFLFTGWLYYRLRIIKSKSILTEKENERLEAERLKSLLEAENLILEKKHIEEERDNLNDLLQKQSGLTQSLRKIVNSRLSILNGLLAKEITNEESYAKPYRKWIESARKNKEEFKNSMREAFSASHPEFMEYLASHGLTVDEINYLCLYALGLRGKDVGEYINLKRHYIVSSEIRKKLGLNEHDANIGLYTRKLMEELDSK